MPRNSLQVACSPACALEVARSRKEKAEKAEVRRRKEKIKTRRELLAEVQVAFNAYIRERDHDRPCISCGRVNAAKWDAGHYRSVGACPELRFHEDNCHRQCARPCNQDLSGNLIEYRKGLVARIGAERVEWLEGPHQPAHWSVEDLIGMRANYRAKAQRIRKGRDGKA